MELETTSKCEICSKMFQDTNSLLRHVRGIHDKLYKKTCHICAKEFLDSRDFRIHLNVVHLVSY